MRASFIAVSLLVAACGWGDDVRGVFSRQPRYERPEIVDPIPAGHPNCQDCSGSEASCSYRYIYACPDGDRCGTDVGCDPACCEGKEEPFTPPTPFSGFPLVAVAGEPWPASPLPKVQVYADRIELDGPRVIHLPRREDQPLRRVVIPELRDPMTELLAGSEAQPPAVAMAVAPETSFATLYGAVHSVSLAGADRVHLAVGGDDGWTPQAIAIVTYHGRLARSPSPEPTDPSGSAEPSDESKDSSMGIPTVEVMARGAAFWRGQNRVEEASEVDADAIRARAVELFGSGSLQVAAPSWTPWRKVAPVVSALRADFDDLSLVVVGEVPARLGETPYSDGSMTTAPSIEIGLSPEDIGSLFPAGELGL